MSSDRITDFIYFTRLTESLTNWEERSLLTVLSHKGTASQSCEPGPLHIFFAAADPVLSQSCALKAWIPMCYDNRPESRNALENLTLWLFNKASEETV